MAATAMLVTKVSYIFLFLPNLSSTSVTIGVIGQDSEWRKDAFMSFAIEDVLSQNGVTSVSISQQENTAADKEINFDSILSIEKCWLVKSNNSMVLPATTGNVGFLQLIIGDCGLTAARSLRTSVPVFMADVHRKYSCVSYVIRIWLSEIVPQISHLKRIKSQNSDYRDIFLGCIGPEFYTAQIRNGLQNERGRAYLNGKKVLIATINRPPFLIFTLGGPDGKEILTWRGYCIDMLNNLAEKFNFSYKLILPPDGNWGAPTPNGTFNGMVGMVQRHEVDFAMASFTITHIREQVIDFTHRFYEDPTTILIPPPVEMKNLFAFLSPFQSTIWICVLVAIFCMSFAIWFVTKHPKGMNLLYPFQAEQNDKARNVEFFEYFYQISFVLVGKSTKLKQTNASRIILGFWWAFGLILSWSYTGTLISFLTIPRMENLIDSLEELSKQRDILWTYRANTAYENLFGEAKPPSTYYKIGLLLKERPQLKVSTDEQGVNAVLYKKMAYIKEKSWLDFAMEDDYLKTGKCRLAQVPQDFFSAGFGWALQEGSAYVSLFNDIFLRMHQNGLFAYWKKRYWPKPNECTASRITTALGPRSLTLEDFSGHFFILGFGATLGLVILLLEVMSRKVFRGNRLVKWYIW